MRRRTASPRKHIVNLPHDFLCPLNASGDEFVAPWASLRTSEEVVCRLHVQARKNSCHQVNCLCFTTNLFQNTAAVRLVRQKIWLIGPYNASATSKFTR
jgi:hypothetical protein